MRGRTAVFILAVAICTLSYSHAARGQTRAGAEGPLTNASVIKLVRAGFKEKTVIAIIRTRPSQFDLSPESLIDLKRGGVSENIILAMLAYNDGVDDADALSDDAFFSGANPRAKNGGSGDGGQEIFGSSGGSSGRTSSRVGGGSSAGNTSTTGSATVRILRPPAEAGGSPKLERTPTLNNESVIELVEAGFTEGTIIRRIEQSPADYDLTPAKVAELRRRRVSDRVIAAMRAAAGEDPLPAQAPSPSEKKQD
ncbi:MAG TPA: hypothetical protein VF507_09180 [Pyrinomonadaceae bacterium]|jgi:hypothetical protein